MLAPGERFGSYEIVLHLRDGGMGSLFLAKRHGAAGFHKYVALKVIRASAGDQDELVQAIVHEAQLASRIAHPNVVHVEELGEVRGTYFIAMEYVDGFGLSQLLVRLGGEGVRLRPSTSVAIVAKIAEGLHAIHE